MNSHIAQQSRRDKLRIQQDIYFPCDALNYEPPRGNGNICYDPSDLCSEMINFSATPLLKRDLDAPFPHCTTATDQHYFPTDWVPPNHTSIYPISASDVKPNYLGYHSDMNGYQNALQELVTSSSFASLRQKSDQWSGHLDRDHSNTQALSLSLSSVPSPKLHQTQIAERDSTSWKPELLSTGSRVLGGAQALTHRNPGPLGPFTGYATILRSSRFLRPAQQLLEELCCIAAPKDVDDILEEARVSSNNADSAGVYGSSDQSREAASCSSDACPPETLQRKAKLLFMQDEVCKRYKQYHQQMQMVVSSFESVAGLSAATPYVSLALKMIAKHFRCLKNSITDQLKNIKNALRDEFSSPSAGTSGNKGDANASVLKFFDQSFQKQKGAGNLGILEGQHIWRPQRGLPERAVSILRAWLFDHFLHPYPTDTDKHMLATQTGLTRNQVSNWFINARVRVWKPMVEEIHMLETKGSDNAGKPTNGKTALEGCDQADDSGQSLNRLRMRSIPDKQVGCSSLGPPVQEADRSKASLWNQEKRSRIEYRVPGGVDGSLMGFVPSHRSGVEMGGIGSVSLTLGLTQSPEGGQRPPMQQERHLRHYGGQIIREFVG